MLGSTDHSVATKGTWFNVATLLNSTPNQSHALTLEVYPHSGSAGGSRQTFFVLARNDASGPDLPPIVLQKILWDSTNRKTRPVSSSPSPKQNQYQPVRLLARTS